MTHVWTIFGDPVGKGRARVFRDPRNGKVHGVTPERTAHWESVAREIFACSWNGGPLEAAVALEIVAVFTRPKRLLRRKDPNGRILCPTKPDWNNVGKAVSDALQKAGVIRDDAQVCDSHVLKFYAARDEGPRVEVKLVRIPSDGAEAELLTPAGGVVVHGPRRASALGAAGPQHDHHQGLIGVASGSGGYFVGGGTTSSGVRGLGAGTGVGGKTG